MIITNILSTDVTSHKNEYEKLKKALEKAKLEAENQTPEGIHSKLLEDQNNKLLVANQLVHIADISNPTKKFSIYKKWVDRVFLEFFAQGDKEKELGLPVTMLCDRETTNIPSSQIFFINFFIKDHILIFSETNPKFKEIFEEVKRNLKIWESLKIKEQQE